MKVQCKNCIPKKGIDLPEFTQSDKTRLILMREESPIKAIKYLMNDFKLSHLESKYITAHINGTYGKSNRCNFDKIDQENLNCPKCVALNLNWMLTPNGNDAG